MNQSNLSQLHPDHGDQLFPATANSRVYGAPLDYGSWPHARTVQVPVAGEPDNPRILEEQNSGNMNPITSLGTLRTHDINSELLFDLDFNSLAEREAFINLGDEEMFNT